MRPHLSRSRILISLAAVTLLCGSIAVPGVASAATDTSASASTPVATAAEQRFVDIPATRGDFEAINWMAERGITTGVGNSGYFRPDRMVTRAEFATFLWRYVDQPEAPSSCGFKDVPSTLFAAKAICWLKANGLTDGVNPEGTRFSPDTFIPRGQAVALVWRLIGRPTSVIPHGFTDIPANAPYEQAAQWFKEFGLTTGKSPTTFGPNDNLTRGQSARFLYRYDLSQIELSAPGTSTIVGVIGSWIEGFNNPARNTGLLARLNPNLQTFAPVPPFGGAFEVNVSEPADRPVDTISVVLPAYLPNPQGSGTITATTSGECTGSTEVRWDLQKVIIETFYCADGNADQTFDGVIDGAVTVHLTGFEHTIRSPGPQGGFAVSYGTAEDMQRRPTNSLVASFDAGSPYLNYLTSQDKDRYLPPQTKAIVRMDTALPTRHGAGTVIVTVNSPASAPIAAVRITANNETSHLGLTFDLPTVWGEANGLRDLDGQPNALPPATEYPAPQMASLTGECSSDPTFYLFPRVVQGNVDRSELVYVDGETGNVLNIEGFECRDWDGDGTINGDIILSFPYALTGVRSFYRNYTVSFCTDPTLLTERFGCVDPNDAIELTGSDVASVELLTRGAYIPTAFTDAILSSRLSRSLDIICNNDPLRCFPDKDYEEFMLKDNNGTYLCLTYPYMCWPEGDWPEELVTRTGERYMIAQEISELCGRHPDRCQGAQSTRPTGIMPYGGFSTL